MVKFIFYYFTCLTIALSHSDALESAQEIINRFNLTPLEPEGGYFRETYNTGFDSGNATFCNNQRSTRSHIYYLLKDETSDHRVSTWHKIIGTEETWYYHMGVPVTILVITQRKDSSVAYETVYLGTNKESTPFFTIPPNTWFVAVVNTSDSKAYSFVSCVCEPGFSYTNFRMATRESVCKEAILLQAWKKDPKLFEYFLAKKNSKSLGKCLDDG